MQKKQQISDGSRPLIWLLWLVLTAFNFGKAYHIDDTFHLEAAHWILAHPGQPMSGLINWDQHPEPLHHFNQPPLFFFMLAGVIRLFGDDEAGLHLFLSLFTYAALHFFVACCRLLQLKHTRLLLLLFAMSPALIVNQNLMTDVPLLATVLATLYFLLRGSRHPTAGNYLAAALCISIACLIKYTALPLIPAMLVVGLVRKHYIALLLALLPVVVLAVWSSWNVWEYGGIHLFGRPTEAFQVKRFADFANCLGAVTLFGALLLARALPAPYSRAAMFVFFAVPAFCVLLAWFGPGHRITANAMLNLWFTVNGALLLAAIVIPGSRRLVRAGFVALRHAPKMPVMVMAGGLSLFILLFAPFMATRHLLLVIPFLLLLAGERLYADRIVTRTVVVLSLLLALAAGNADRDYAGYYRRVTQQVPDSPNTTWYAGHWGWQWYAAQRGWRQLDATQPMLKAGDRLLSFYSISQQNIDKNKLHLEQKSWEDPGPFQRFCCTPARFYASGIDLAPWQIDALPVDTLYIWKVER